jgi:hypothetical protein
MLVCKKCQNNFPRKVIINGKTKDLRRRSYCLSCSPWGDKKGYSLRKEKTDKQKDGKNKCCPICEKLFPWTKNDVCSTCRCLYTRFCHKRKAIEILGGKCIKCGEAEQCFLTFHHENPENKTLEISGAFGVKKWEIIEKELEQCVLLCLKCHTLEHFNEEKLCKVIAYYEKKDQS